MSGLIPVQGPSGPQCNNIFGSTYAVERGKDISPRIPLQVNNGTISDDPVFATNECECASLCEQKRSAGACDYAVYLSATQQCLIKRTIKEADKAGVRTVFRRAGGSIVIVGDISFFENPDFNDSSRSSLADCIRTCESLPEGECDWINIRTEAFVDAASSNGINICKPKLATRLEGATLLYLMQTAATVNTATNSTTGATTSSILVRPPEKTSVHTPVAEGKTPDDAPSSSSSSAAGAPSSDSIPVWVYILVALAVVFVMLVACFVFFWVRARGVGRRRSSKHTGKNNKRLSGWKMQEGASDRRHLNDISSPSRTTTTRSSSTISIQFCNIHDHGARHTGAPMRESTTTSPQTETPMAHQHLQPIPHRDRRHTQQLSWIHTTSTDVGNSTGGTFGFGPDSSNDTTPSPQYRSPTRNVDSLAYLSPPPRNSSSPVRTHKPQSSAGGSTSTLNNTVSTPSPKGAIPSHDAYPSGVAKLWDAASPGSGRSTFTLPPPYTQQSSDSDTLESDEQCMVVRVTSQSDSEEGRLYMFPSPYP